MSVDNTTVAQTYNGNGVTTTFAIPFDYEPGKASEVTKVYLVDEDDGSSVLQVEGSNYDLDPVGDNPANVIFDIAPASDKKVLVERAEPYVQEAEYDNVGVFPNALHERVLDRIVRMCQQLLYLMGFKFGLNRLNQMEGFSPEFPYLEADKLLKVNAAGTAIEAVDSDAFQGPPGPEGPQGDQGAQGTPGPSAAIAVVKWQEGPLTATPAFENQMQVYIFESGLGQKLYALLKVPASFTPGTPINLKGFFYSPDNSGTVLFYTVATLLKKDVTAANSVDNQHTSTNSAVNLSSALVVNEIEMDLTDNAGEINSVQVEPGDIIKIELAKGGTSTSGVRFIPNVDEMA